MLASCIGYDKTGRERQKNIDAFDDNDVIKHVHITDISETPNNIFYSSKAAEDNIFNLIYFYKTDGTSLLVQTAGTVYIMDDSGKTFDIIKK